MNKMEKDTQGNSQNENHVKVNNTFSFSINFGDSLNLLILLTGAFIFKEISNQYKIKKKLLKDNKRKECKQEVTK